MGPGKPAYLWLMDTLEQIGFEIVEARRQAFSTIKNPPGPRLGLSGVGARLRAETRFRCENQVHERDTIPEVGWHLVPRPRGESFNVVVV